MYTTSKDFGDTNVFLVNPVKKRDHFLLKKFEYVVK